MRKAIAHIAKMTGIHGMEKHLLSLLPALTDSYDTTLVLMHEPSTPLSDYQADMRRAGINVLPLIIRGDADPFCFMQLLRLLKKLKPALVHTHLIHGDLYGIAAARLVGAHKVISTKHNDDRFRRTFPISLLNRLLNKRVTAAVAISDWVRTFTVSAEKIPEQRISTIYYGMKPLPRTPPRQAVRETLKIPDDAVMFGIIARLTEQKGIGTLIDAFSDAHTQNSRMRLIIAGDGERKAELENLAASKKLDSVVHFLGYRNDVAALLGAMDVFVHPSLWEGFGLAILEAMAAGKPVIATSVSAIPELVQNGVTGILVPPADRGELARAMLTLSRSDDLIQQYGVNGKRRWQDCFTHDAMVEKTKRLYGALLDTATTETT